jgi:hypothetical protein
MEKNKFAKKRTNYNFLLKWILMEIIVEYGEKFVDSKI